MLSASVARSIPGKRPNQRLQLFYKSTSTSFSLPTVPGCFVHYPSNGNRRSGHYLGAGDPL